MPPSPSETLIKAVAVAAELTGARFSEAAAVALLERLARYEESAVLAALDRCVTELRNQPLTLSAILERLDDGHPGPEEAWALVANTDDDDTIVWTDQVARAWAVARSLMHDRVAARMAFLECYREQLAKARGAAEAPTWRASLGWDASKRAAALARAVELKRLPIDTARRALPDHEWPAAWSPSRALPVSAEDGKAHAAALVQAITRKMAARVRFAETAK